MRTFKGSEDLKDELFMHITMFERQQGTLGIPNPTEDLTLSFLTCFLFFYTEQDNLNTP